MNISEVLSKANLQMRHFHRFQLEHDMEMTSQDDDLKNTEELDNLSQGLQIISKENQDKEQEEIQSKIKEVKNSYLRFKTICRLQTTKSMRRSRR